MCLVFFDISFDSINELLPFVIQTENRDNVHYFICIGPLHTCTLNTRIAILWAWDMQMLVQWEHCTSIKHQVQE